MNDIPDLTFLCLQAGFSQLTAREQRALVSKEVTMCIFAEPELELFHAAGFEKPGDSLGAKTVEKRKQLLARLDGRASASPADTPLVSKNISDSTGQSESPPVVTAAVTATATKEAPRRTELAATAPAARAAASGAITASSSKQISLPAVKAVPLKAAPVKSETLMKKTPQKTPQKTVQTTPPAVSKRSASPRPIPPKGTSANPTGVSKDPDARPGSSPRSPRSGATKKGTAAKTPSSLKKKVIPALAVVDSSAVSLSGMGSPI
jgi:hypothetical protein